MSFSVINLCEISGDQSNSWARGRLCNREALYAIIWRPAECHPGMTKLLGGYQVGFGSARDHRLFSRLNQAVEALRWDGRPESVHASVQSTGWAEWAGYRGFNVDLTELTLLVCYGPCANEAERLAVERSIRVGGARPPANRNMPAVLRGRFYRRECHVDGGARLLAKMLSAGGLLKPGDEDD